MAKVKFPSEMPSANNIGGNDKMMIAKEGTGETYQATFDQAKNFLEISGIEMKAVPPGALPAGPSGQNRKMEVGSGTWTYGGNTFTIPAGSIGTLWWNGSTWSLEKVVELPTVDVESITSSKNIFNPLEVEAGKYIDPTSFNEMNNVNYSLSGFIPVTASTQYVISGYYRTHYAIGLAFYNSSKVKLSGGTVAIPQNTTTGGFTTPANCAFVRLTVKTGSSSDRTDPYNIQVEQGASVTSFQPFKNVIGVEDSRIFATKAITNSQDDKSPVNIEYFNNNTPTLQRRQYGKNKFNASAVISGSYIDATTGDIVTNANYSVSPFIPVTGGKTYTVSGFGNAHYALGVAYYDINQNKIANTQIGGTSTQSFKLYATDKNVAYVRFTVKTGHGSDNTNPANIQMEEGFESTSYEAYKTGVYQISNTDIAITGYTPKTKGLHMFLLGDSITDTSAYNFLLPANYPFFMANVLETTFDNFALSGASFTDWAYTGGERQRLSKQVQDAIASGVVPDVILINIGTNDYVRQSLLGDYDTTMGKSIESLDRTLILEAARWAFYTLKNAFPNAKCFYATPLQRFSTSNGNESNNYGDWLRNPLIRLAERYNFTVIDQYSKSGIVRDWENNGTNGRFLIDGLHTNQAGKKKQGEFIASEILKAI